MPKIRAVRPGPRRLSGTNRQGVTLTEVLVHLSLSGEIEAEGGVNVGKRDRILLRNFFGGRPLLVCLHNRIKRDARPADPNDTVRIKAERNGERRQCDWHRSIIRRIDEIGQNRSGKWGGVALRDEGGGIAAVRKLVANFFTGE